MFNKKVIRHNMKIIQSKLHRIRTYDICKISLSLFDDERYILDDGVNSLAYFHKDIKEVHKIDKSFIILIQLHNIDTSFIRLIRLTKFLEVVKSIKSCVSVDF